MIKVQSFCGGYDKNFMYVVWDSITNEGIIIDTALPLNTIHGFVKDKQIKLLGAIVMHSHFDHTVGLDEYTIPLWGHENLPIFVHRTIKDGDVISFGKITLRVLYLPGHIPDAICLFAPGMLFTTDVLFIDSCGRCDLDGGDSTKMYYSLQRLKELPNDTIIYAGHDYGHAPTDTLGHQRKVNSYLRCNDLEEFKELRR